MTEKMTFSTVENPLAWSTEDYSVIKFASEEDAKKAETLFRDQKMNYARWAVADLGQIYGLLDEGKFEEASDYCRAAADSYTQDLVE